MTENRIAPADLIEVAQDYVDRSLPAGEWAAQSIAHLGSLSVELDEGYCREVADHFDRAPRRQPSADLSGRYRRLKWENLRQYEAVLDAGIRVEPWLGDGQPYHGSDDLREQVLRTGRLYVYLTAAGHGSTADDGQHPMREPSGISVSGVELWHNDLFRAVHDVFGHVMLGNSFGPRGEFKAAYSHMRMYSEDVHPVVFSEQVGQICWFFFGPHLADESGRLRTPGDPGYVPPSERPYAEQKVFAFPPSFLDRFNASFQEER